MTQNGADADRALPRVLYITLGSWIEDTAHLAARLQLENGGLRNNRIVLAGRVDIRLYNIFILFLYFEEIYYTAV